MIETLRREIRTVDAQLPILELTTFQKFHDNSLELWGIRTGGRMLMAFERLALGLAVAGVYGVKSYSSPAGRARSVFAWPSAPSRPTLGMVMKESLGLTIAGLGRLADRAADGTGHGRRAGRRQRLRSLTFLIAPVVLAMAAMVASYIGTPRNPGESLERAADGVSASRVSRVRSRVSRTRSRVSSQGARGARSQGRLVLCARRGASRHRTC